MPLPTGTWKINWNGHVGPLQILAVDPNGNVSGHLLAGGAGPEPNCLGFWDEDSQRLTFYADTGYAAEGFPSEVHVFTGYLFQDSISVAGVTGSTIFSLAGYSEGFTGTSTFGNTARKSLLGWYAQIGVE